MKYGIKIDDEEDQGEIRTTEEEEGNHETDNIGKKRKKEEME